MARKSLLLCALLFTQSFSSAAGAQELNGDAASESSLVEDEAVSADNEWFSGIDPSWDPSWMNSWYQPRAGLTLALTAGARWQGHQLEDGDLLSPQAQRHQDRELYALATLRVPLHEWGSVGRSALSERATGLDTETQPPKSSDDEQSTAPSEFSSAEQASRAGSHLQQEPFVVSTPKAKEKSAAQEESRRALLRLTRELLKRVRRGQGAEKSEQRLNSLTRRSRHAGLVPELRLRGVYGIDRTTSLEDVGGLYPGETSTRGGHDSLLEARLTFRLDRLVYGDQESSLLRQRGDFEEQQYKRAFLAVEELSKWLEAERRVNDPALLYEETMDALVKSEKSLLQLHLMSDGWFCGEETLRSLEALSLLNMSRDTFSPQSIEAAEQAEIESNLQPGEP